MLIDLASETSEFTDVIKKLPDRTRAALLVEFYADDADHGREQVEELLADRLIEAVEDRGPNSTEDVGNCGPTDVHNAFDALEAYDTDERASLWKLRKSGLPILLGRTSDAKHISFLEDCAVPPERLPEFVSEFQSTLEAPDRSLAYHGHCHQKATKKDHHAVGVLRRAGYAVDPLDSGCCGMAGSFGYETEHQAMSTAIGDLLNDQLGESSAEVIVAPGASCRTQLSDMETPIDDQLTVSDDRDSPPTPIEALEVALRGRSG